MTLEELGYSVNLEEYRKEENLDIFHVGRIISEHKDRYVVITATCEFDSNSLAILDTLQRADMIYPQLVIGSQWLNMMNKSVLKEKKQNKY